jgi:hypothetical protein
MTAKLRTFRVVAEKSHGIIGNSGRTLNPFHIRNVFDPNLTIRVERRTWDRIPATSERAARRLFDEACAANGDMRGFKLVSLVEVKPAPTTCGSCIYEEADGELMEQCTRCKAIDAGRA